MSQRCPFDSGPAAGLRDRRPRRPSAAGRLAVAAAVATATALPAAAAAPADAIIDTDFSKLAQADLKKLPPHERVSGGLPGQWADDSTWANVSVRYRPIAEPAGRCLRMEITKMKDGRAQLMHLIPDFAKPTLFRLELTARSPSRNMAEVGIRLRGRPYTFLWSTNVALPTAWRTYTFDFRLRPNPQRAGLWINLGSVGAIDLARVRLVRLTREALAAELKAKYPGGGPPNLLRNSRMPLGLQSGWSIGRDNSDGDDVLIAPDAKVVGPSGSPALAIQSQEPVKLHTAPFAVPMALDDHVASLYARGSGKLHLAVVGGRHRGGKATAELSAKTWTRLWVRFTPDILRKVYGLRLGCEGEVWIDALQVARGTKPAAYTAQLDCEVALAVEPVTRVQFDDEPASVRWAVTGQADGAVLRAEVVNPYGQRVKLDGIRLSKDFCQAGTLRYDRIPGRPYGPFRIEARVETAAGRAVSPPNELVVYRLRRPRYWMKDAPHSPFGTHTNSTTRHILMAKSVGVNWTRLHDAGTPYIGWFHLEPEKGKWLFRDKELKRYRTYGMKILGAFSTAPKWASHFRHEKPHSGYFDRYYQPLRMEDFAHYVRTVTERYKGGVIDAWDVWNEPWIHAWWGVDYDETKKDRSGYVTSKDAPADFARLMATAYRAAKAADGRATVCGVNTTTGGSGEAWTRGVVAAGGLDHCDAVVYHQYTAERMGFPGDAAERGFQKAVGAAIAKAGKLAQPVWMTEGSPNPRGLGDGFYHYTVPQAAGEDLFDAGDRLSRYVVALLGQGVRKIFLYSMHGHGYFGGGGWRVLVTSEGYLHPSAAALATTTWLLEDTRFVRRFQPAKNVTAYLFEAPGRSVAVLSPGPGQAAYVPPRPPGVEALDLFGNPAPAGEPIGPHVVYLHAKTRAEPLAKLLTAPAATKDRQ